jgi:prolyl-tRNA editing enzyme YbaK/EbsC (Cys-tRNA(Pro) deacylase)
MMIDKVLTPADLNDFMQRHNISGEIIFLDTPTPTVETAAKAVHSQPDGIVKSILFLVDGSPVLAITCGPAHIDRRALATEFEVGRKKIKLADPETVLQLTGFQVGAMPPFGHYTPLPTLLDRRVMENAEVFAGGGAENALLRLAPGDLLNATQAKVIDLISSRDDP